MDRFLRVVAAALFVMITFAYPLLAPMFHRIDGNHFGLIRPGMTEADVEAILGVPAGVYDWATPRNESVPEFLREIERQHCPGGPKVRTWMSRHCAFIVEFDALGRVHDKHGLGETRVDYPWQYWWRRLMGHGR
jgi:hypothetical protein